MYKTRNKTGKDITSKRFGILEKKALNHIVELNNDEIVYDLGSGQSFFSIIIAFLGKRIFTIDKNFNNFSFFKLKVLKNIFNLKKIKVIKKDISKMSYKDFENNISTIYSSRFFHYLTYSEGIQLLKILSKKMKEGGLIYFSISGINSDLGFEYKGKDIDLEKRFFEISSTLKKRFEIEEKVCLYSIDEIKKIFSKFFVIEEI
jgi:cyclopropane fatty-acyl-phospholipid synthase-like methyltransferase